MVAGVWGNSNYDPHKEGEQGARRELLEFIDTQYKDAIKLIYSGKAEPEKKAEDEDIWSKPFFAASKAPRIRYDEGLPEKTREQQVERRKMIDQLDQS